MPPTRSNFCARGLGPRSTAATFKATYGTNADKPNAFGRCVSKLAAAQQDA